MRKYVQVKLIGGGSYIQPLEDLDVLIDEIKESHVGTEWILTLIEMDEEEYESLEEFAGH